MKVVNIGSANIDYVYKMEHFIRPGETAPCQSLTKGCGGKGLNQSVALAQAGLQTYHACILGAEAQFLQEKLQEKGVDVSLIRCGEGANGHAIIQVDASGQNCIILYGGTNQQFTHEYIDYVLAQFSAGDIAVLQNEINELPYIIDRCYEKGIRVAFNAAPYKDEIRRYPLEKVTWLIVNEVEGGGLSGETNFEKIADALYARYPQTGIMLTMGKAGCLYRDARDSIRIPAYCVDAVDTTAAGDTFIGYFIRGMADGLPVERTLQLASMASAIAVTRHGAADSVPAYDEVLQKLENQ